MPAAPPEPKPPEVWANCATSLDGKLAARTRRQVRLSGPDDMARVHRLRNASDAILVGVGTVLADDPKLTVKADHLPPGEAARTPLKVVLDSRCRTPPDCQAIATPGDVLVACLDGEAADVPGAEVRAFPAGPDGRVDPVAVLKELEARGVARVLVEGGGEVLWSFLSRDLVDRLTVYVAPVVLGGRNAPTLADGEGAADLDAAARLRFDGAEALDDGVLLTWTRA